MLSRNLGGKALRVWHWVGWVFFFAARCCMQPQEGCMGVHRCIAPGLAAAPSSGPASLERPEEPQHSALVFSILASSPVPHGELPVPLGKGKPKRGLTLYSETSSHSRGMQETEVCIPACGSNAACSVFLSSFVPRDFFAWRAEAGVTLQPSSPTQPAHSSPSLWPRAAAGISKGTQHPPFASASFCWVPRSGRSSKKSALGN